MLYSLNSNLYKKDESEKYYDDKYSRKRFLNLEYMDEWNEEKKERIFNLIRELDLPEKGDALDFGCGSGVLTDLIRRALPGYHVYGADLSRRAIDKARERYKKCTFFHTADEKYNRNKFDFLFTHHVLEHVYDIYQVADQIAAYMKPASIMLHILPCGNDGSLEHNLCSLRNNGINPEKEGVFFFEDEGHVRRLKTTQLNNIFLKYNFKLAADYYSEQYYGALKWITESNPFLVLKMANPFYGKDLRARIQLLKIGALLVALNMMRMPINLINRIKRKRINDFKNYLLYTACLVFYPLSYPIDKYVRNKAAEEWGGRKKERNGSEMYLVYARPGKEKLY